MHVLFIHQAFPAQFGRLGLELHKRYGWKCSYLIENLSSCPTPTVEMLQKLDIQRLPLSEEFRKERLTPWPQAFGHHLQLCQAVFEAVRTRPDLRPDLVVGHDGLGPALFLPELLSCPIVNYCEYYFSPRRRDISYRIDLPSVEPAEFYPRSINAATLINLAAFAHGYAPTHWQRQTFPEHFRHKIEVHFDGIDTELYQPRRLPRTFAGRTIPADHRLVTFVARGLESMRGFDLFMRLAQRIAWERSDVLLAVVGQDRSYYGWDRLHTGQTSFKQWVLSRNNYDLSRFIDGNIKKWASMLSRYQSFLRTLLKVANVLFIEFAGMPQTERCQPQIPHRRDGPFFRGKTGSVAEAHQGVAQRLRRPNPDTGMLPRPQRPARESLCILP